MMSQSAVWATKSPDWTAYEQEYRLICTATHTLLISNHAFFMSATQRATGCLCCGICMERVDGFLCKYCRRGRRVHPLEIMHSSREELNRHPFRIIQVLVVSVPIEGKALAHGWTTSDFSRLPCTAARPVEIAVAESICQLLSNA